MVSDTSPDWLAIAERAVALATAAGATEAEALVSAADAQLTRFANSEIHQNVAETNADLQSPLRHRQAGRASPRRAGSTTRGCVASSRVPGRSPATSRSSSDWAGLPEPDGARRRRCRRSCSRRDRRSRPGAACRGGPGGHRRRRRGGRHRLRLVRDQRRADGGRQLARHPRRRRSGRGRSSSRSSMGPDGGTGYAEAAAVDVTAIDAAALGREAAEQGPGDRLGPLHRARRLPRRPRGVRGRRRHGHARLPRVQRPGRPGGALVRRDRQADRLDARDDPRRRRRPGRPADGVRLRGGRPSSACRSSIRRLRGHRLRLADGRPGRGPLDRPRPAGPEPVRTVPAQHGDGPLGRRRATSSSAGWTAASSSPASTTRTRSTRSSAS